MARKATMKTLRWGCYPHLLSLLLSVASQDLGSPTDYAPSVSVTCPNTTSTPLVRTFSSSNQTLNALEESYVDTRQATVIADAWEAWLGDGSGIGYNASTMDKFKASNFSKVGIAVSGGGYRAAQYGAGVLMGLDVRNESAKAAGTGGLLQVTSYISALSGGSWLTGSLFFNNWPTIPDMVFGNGGNLSGWILDLNLASPDGDDLFDDDNQYFFGSILWSVVSKANKGLYTSITDPWARMISYHFLNSTTRSNFFQNSSAHGAGQLWSDIPLIPAFQQHQTPFPLVVANSRPVGSNLTTALPPEPIVYEITPAEFGSWDPNLSAMVNITYAGTNFNNGTPPNTTGCVTGFDQAGFMMGTSASLFNQILDRAHNTIQGFTGSDSKSILYMLNRQLTDVRTIADDVANWPNPFQSLRPDTFEDSNATWLQLIDGSSNEENVPLGQQFVKVRGLDVILALDASADTSDSWPNGSSIVKSQQRITTLLQDTHQSFPPIPATTDQFISTGINQRPTFFGCFPSNNPPEFPLVIYLPNSPPVGGDDPVSNTGTFQIDYTNKHTTIFLNQVQNNTMSGFVPNEKGSDPNFGKCLQCAAIDRARYKVSPVVDRSDTCNTCFDQYCFSPASPPSSSEIVGRKYAFVDPDPQGVSKVSDFFDDHKVPIILGIVGVVLVIIAAIFILRRVTKKRDQAYKRLTMQAEGSDAPWKAYTDRLGSFELDERRESVLKS